MLHEALKTPINMKEELILMTTKLLSGMDGEPVKPIFSDANYEDEREEFQINLEHWNQSKEKAEQIHEGYKDFMLHLVDIVWNDVTESNAVPSTDHAKKLIKKAGESLNL